MEVQQPMEVTAVYGGKYSSLRFTAAYGGKLVLSYIIHHNSGSESGIKIVRLPLYTHNTPLSDGNKIYSKLKCLQLANLQQTMVNQDSR